MSTRFPAPPSSFSLIDHRRLPLWGGEGAVYRHASGARVLSIATADENKTFAAVFPTPPRDHTGLPHILEHCVLCGSDRFPVKEPFKEMLKTSLQTFLNAFTYPDRTCYPVASQNLRDFHNLVDIYLDAVFHPRLTPAVLGQEGWRWQWNADGRLEIQGVVYNEMKGAYSSPEARLEVALQKALYPDTPYFWDYGGDPAHIPELGFDDFLNFHRAHYHPANAWIAFYGNDDPAARLERVEAALAGLPSGPVPEPPSLQPPWTTPRTHRLGYPASPDNDEGIYQQSTWLLEGDTADTYRMQVAGLASTLLLNSPSSPLRLALLESGLGDDLVGGAGFHLRQPHFGAGLKGVGAGDADHVTDCVLGCLEGLVRDGFRPDLVEGVLNLSEFQMRELNTGNKGLWAILSSIQPWLYGGDPLEALDPEPRLRRIREAATSNPAFFSDWVRENLVDNPGRLDITLSPDPGLGAREREAEDAVIREESARLTADPERERRVRDLAEAVRSFQETPDDPGALATLPRLGLDDIDPLPDPPPMEVGEFEGVEVGATSVDSNGIVYLHFAFGIGHLSLEDLHLLPLYSRCLTELGTTHRGQLTFNEQVACHTGGLSVRFETSTSYTGAPVSDMVLKIKCLVAKADATRDVLADMFANPLLGPEDKVLALLQEERAGEESHIQQSGNQAVSQRLKALYSSAERAGEEIDGVSYLAALRKLEQEPLDSLIHRLRDLHHRVCIRPRRSTRPSQAGAATAPPPLRVHVGGDADARRVGARLLRELASILPETRVTAPSAWAPLPPGGPEGLVIPSPVNYVGLSTRLPEGDAAEHFSHFVAQRLLNTDFLWERVRMRGGAYGCSGAFSHLERTFVFSSYRDPHLDATLDRYREAATWLAGLSISPADLEQAVIGTLGKMSPPERPSTLVAKRFYRHRIGLTHERRRRFREEIRDTTPKHLRAFGEALEGALNTDARMCVLGGEHGISSSSLPFHTTRVL